MQFCDSVNCKCGDDARVWMKRSKSSIHRWMCWSTAILRVYAGAFADSQRRSITSYVMPCRLPMPVFSSGTPPLLVNYWCGRVTDSICARRPVAEAAAHVTAVNLPTREINKLRNTARTVLPSSLTKFEPIVHCEKAHADSSSSPST